MTSKQMADFDKLQLLTLVFGAVVILDVITAYNNSQPDQRVEQPLKVLQEGIGYFFAGYAIVTVAGATGRQYGMYKWFILLLSLAAWLYLIIDTSASGIQGSGAIRDKVAHPLAMGSLIALPVVLVARK